MVTIANYSAKAGSLILGVAGAAAGLNLSVLALQPEVPGSPEQVSMVADGDPEVIQVEVDVPVPVGQLADEETMEDPETVVAGATAPATGPVMTPVRGVNPAPAPAAPSATPAAGVPTSPPTTGAAPTPTNPPTTLPPTTAPTSPPTTTATTQAGPVTEYLSYSFDGVASIVIALHDGERLEFWSVNAQSGWAYQVEKDDGHTVKIEFEKESGGEEQEAVFEVKIEDGGLRVKKELGDD